MATGPPHGLGAGGKWIWARTLLVLRSVLQVAGRHHPFGKTAYTDDTHRGFWIGVDGNGAATAEHRRAGPLAEVDGQRPVIRGAFYTPTVAMDEAGLALREGDGMSNRLRYVTAGARTWRPTERRRTAGPGSACRRPSPHHGERPVDLEVDGDFGATAAAVGATKRQRPPAGCSAGGQPGAHRSGRRGGCRLRAGWLQGASASAVAGGSG